ncbi:MAG: Spy/CpxP family protein refolding chaperone [Deltaproteobacteria bacterium]|nr:Spy/CpxP family protein refolding chaperone [Deltaproteobacteria bacterium]
MKKFAVTMVAAAASLWVLAPFALGQTSGPAMGPGMMMGPSMAGPGMMTGSGMGSGMMMGPGMAGHGQAGHGQESGMMRHCGGMMGRMMEGEQHLSKYLMGLNLDEQQKKMIGEIKSKMMKETIRKMADIRIGRIEIKDLLHQDPLDMKAVEAKVKQIGQMRTEMALAHIMALEEIKSKLTPEQRKKFVEMMKAHPMRGRMGMGHE